ncbi:methyl-accepting chemotaxis protein [Methanospirillum stamsii]|nr:methyl-accepting chemotaxis protein [Methanospirillum stamsii]
MTAHDYADLLSQADCDTVRKLIQVLPVPTLVIRNNTIEYGNQAFKTLFHLDGDDSGRDPVTLFSPEQEDNTSAATTLSSLMRQVSPDNTVSRDLIAIKSDKALFPVRITLVPVTWNKEDSFLMTILDISKEVANTKKIEAFTDEVAWYRSILDAVQFPIHVTDLDMNWTFMNKAFEAVLLKNKVIKDRESALGLPCHTANATICRTEGCGIHQLRTKGITESYFEWQGMNGKQVTKEVVNAKGETIGYVETVQDLTDILSVQEYTKREVDRIDENLKRLAEGNLEFNLKINEPDQYTKAEYEAFKKMNERLLMVHDSYGAVIADIKTVTEALVKGDLNVRADVLKHQGDNRKVIEGLNATVDAMADKVAWYRSILDAVQFPIHVTDLDMNWTFMNKAFEAVLLKNKVIKDRESAMGLPCHTANATICRTEGCGIHQLRTKGVTESYFEWQGMNGKQVTKEVVNAKGETIGYVETVQDLTDQLNQIAYYQSILDAVPFPIHVMDMDMRWTFLNKAFEKLLIDNRVIKDRESAYGLPCHTANANICKTNKCGITQLKTTGENETYFDWMGSSCKQTTALVLDGQGNSVGYVETVQDLTEQLSLIAFLKAEVDRLSANIEKLSEGDFTLNMEITRADVHAKEAEEMFKVINGNVDKLLINLENLTADAIHLSEKAVLGELSTRIDLERYHGEFQKVMKGINETLDSVMEPANEAMRLCTSYANYNFKDRFNMAVHAEGDWIALKNALNSIGVQVSAAVNLIIQQVNDLSINVEQSNATVEEVSAGAQQIAINANKVSQNAENGGEGIRQVLRAMEDLNETVAAVSRKTEAVSGSSNQANTFAREGIDLAEKSEHAMDEITQSTEEVNLIVTDINHEMDEIGKIVHLISDIANQTNLLALNAAIEAARAGEAGRGFAVVAAEVKSLAQDSRRSAENITGMIGKLQNKTKKATEAMKLSSTAVKEGGDSLQQTVRAFTEIADTIEGINNNIVEVASASEEQAASVEEVTASIQEVSNMIESTAHEAGDSAAATEEATASLEEISKLMASVVTIVDSVSHEMKKFTV